MVDTAIKAQKNGEAIEKCDQAYNASKLYQKAADYYKMANMEPFALLWEAKAAYLLISLNKYNDAYLFFELVVKYCVNIDSDIVCMYPNYVFDMCLCALFLDNDVKSILLTYSNINNFDGSCEYAFLCDVIEALDVGNTYKFPQFIREIKSKRKLQDWHLYVLECIEKRAKNVFLNTLINSNKKTI